MLGGPDVLPHWTYAVILRAVPYSFAVKYDPRITSSVFEYKSPGVGFPNG